MSNDNPKKPGSVQPRRHLLVATVAAVVVTAAVALFVTKPWADPVPDGAAFTYGDRVVSVDELDRYLDIMRTMYGFTEPTNAKERANFRREAAKSLASSMMLSDQQKSRGIEISQKEARDKLSRYVKETFGDRDDFIKALGEVGASESDAIVETQRQLGLAELVDDVVGDVEISDSELTTAFKRRQAALATPQKRRLRNLVLPDEASARRVVQRLESGASITDVAAEESLDDSTRMSGGDLGYVSQRDMEPAVGEAAFAVKRGDFYGPVEGQFGWNVGRVDRVVPGRPAVFRKIRKDLRQQLVVETSSQRWQRWLGDQLKKAPIEYHDDYRPRSPTSVARVPGLVQPQLQGDEPGQGVGE